MLEYSASQLSPRQQLINMVRAYTVPQLIYVAAKLSIADALAEQPKSFAELTALIEAEPTALKRLLRGLVNIGLLVENDEGKFSLTALGECLVSSNPGSLRDVAILQAEEMYHAWGSLLYSVKTGQPAFEHVFGTNLFDYLANHVEVGARFNNFMANSAYHVGKALAKAYDFSQFAQVVDVGGGNGALLAAILNFYPRLKGVLFDRASVLEEANLYLAETLERCQLIAGDFFAEIPTGGDVYILSQIIHDWDDAKALTILSNCHRAMHAEARLLLFEAVLPKQTGTASKVVDKDLCMLVLTGGRERTEQEFEQLLNASSFEITRVIQTAHSRAIIEAVPCASTDWQLGEHH